MDHIFSFVDMELFEKVQGSTHLASPRLALQGPLSLHSVGLSPLPGTDLRKRLLRKVERCRNHRAVGDKQLAEEQLGDPRDQMGGLRCKGTVRECLSQEAFGCLPGAGALPGQHFPFVSAPYRVYFTSDPGRNRGCPHRAGGRGKAKLCLSYRQ